MIVWVVVQLVAPLQALATVQVPRHTAVVEEMLVVVPRVVPRVVPLLVQAVAVLTLVARLLVFLPDMVAMVVQPTLIKLDHRLGVV